jgi:acetyl-CoA acyltransferase 2
MALTAENLAVKYNLTKAQVDEFALRSQHLWKKAQDEGAFKAEIEAFKLKIKGKEVDFQVDEHPR